MATVQVRMYEVTKKKFDNVALDINEARADKRKVLLTTADLLEEAVDMLIKYKSRLSK